MMEDRHDFLCRDRDPARAYTAPPASLPMRFDDSLLRYYNDELAYLREMGREFARQYPMVANRLELQDGHPADPHVERLIESFAFLTGRIQRELDAEFPEITT